MRFSNCALLLLAAAFPTRRGVVADDHPNLSSPTAGASSASAPGARELKAKNDKTKPPTESPTMDPSGTPSMDPSALSSELPSEVPSMNPSVSMIPSDLPTMNPTSEAEKKVIYNYTGTPQYFTAPKDGFWTITAVGARGGNCSGCDQSTCLYCYGKGDPISACPKVSYLTSPENERVGWCYKCDAQDHNGGFGALAKGTFFLNKGDKIEIIVGGMGQDCQTIEQQLPIGSFAPESRDYLEALTGAGGGGGTSVSFVYADKREELLLAAGGGGGATKFFNGEDGENGPNGGFNWGGKDGKGGGLAPSQLPQFGGAGGGGMSGDGESVKAIWSSNRLKEYVVGKVGQEVVWAEGGFSLSNGSQGGYVNRTEYEKNEVLSDVSEATAQSGSAGGYGYGSGGQGGSGEYSFQS